jgi:hypothetical protein
MPRTTSETGFFDEMADKLGLPTETRCNNVVKWDGRRLYVTEEIYRETLGTWQKTRQRKRDVTEEIAAALNRYAKAKQRG